MTSRIFTLPNVITLVRILLLPVFIWAMRLGHPFAPLISAGVFLILSGSDLLDGYLARKHNTVSNLGKILDPLADKLLIGSALILLTGKGVPLWITIVILIREIGITLLRFGMAARGVIIAAEKLGKLKAVAQTVAITMIILSIPYAYPVLLLAVVLTLISGAEYIFKLFRPAQHLP